MTDADLNLVQISFFLPQNGFLLENSFFSTDIGNFNSNILDPEAGFKKHSLLIGIPVAVAVLLLIGLVVFLIARKGHLR